MKRKEAIEILEKQMKCLSTADCDDVCSDCPYGTNHYEAARAMAKAIKVMRREEQG